MYNSSLSPITTLAREVGETPYPLPSQEADLNIYLNGTYYNGLSAEAQRIIVDGIYKVGVLNFSNNQTLSTEIDYANTVKWQGKVALIDATEYARASTNIVCSNINSFVSDSLCYNNPQDWMYDNSIYWWTISPYSYSRSYTLWRVSSEANLHHGSYASFTSNVRPVVTLSPEVQITDGTGSSSDSYQLTI